MADNKKKVTEIKVDIRTLPKKRPKISGLIVVLIILTMISSVYYIFSGMNYKGEETSLSNIVKDISEEKYDQIVLKDDLVMIDELDKKGELESRKYALLPEGTNFYEVLSNANIDIKTLENDFYQPKLGITVGDVISIIFLVVGSVLLFMLMKNMQNSGGKIMDFGQSNARLLFGKKTGISFDDVAGIDDVKEELTEVVDFLKHPKKYSVAGARIPKGVLLAGAPGTGKTLLAKAVAGEAGVPFFHTSGSEFEEMLVGAGASRVRDLFKKAKRAAPCIIFIDEIDAVAKKRGTVLHSGAGEQTLNQILVEMDGLEERENVIVLAATNRPDVLDPAILRPGRFDRMVVVRMPDYKGRKEILDVHAKNKKFEEGVNLDFLAKKTVGYSGADLENLLNEAAIMAAKDDRKTINQEDLSESYLKVKFGRKKKQEDDEDDIKKTAYHEAGHAIVARFTKNAHPVEQVSIVSRGMAGGLTVYIPDKEDKYYTKSQFEASLRTAVAGKVAEELYFGESSTGPGSDIKHATEVAKEMVTQYGMSEKLGFVQYGDMEDTKHLGYTYGGGRDYSEKTAELIDQEVKRLIDEAQVDSKKILEGNKVYVEKLVALLLEKEVVGREEYEKIFE